MAEINAIIDAAEDDIVAGRIVDDEDAWKEDFMLMEKEEPEMAETIRPHAVSGLRINNNFC